MGLQLSGSSPPFTVSKDLMPPSNYDAFNIIHNSVSQELFSLKMSRRNICMSFSPPSRATLPSHLNFLVCLVAPPSVRPWRFVIYFLNLKFKENKIRPTGVGYDCLWYGRREQYFEETFGLRLRCKLNFTPEMENIFYFEMPEHISKLHRDTFQKTIMWLITAMGNQRLMFVLKAWPSSEIVYICWQ
jgi:hypothetical protein